MKNHYTLKSSLIAMCFLMFVCLQTSVYGQISINATGGTPTGSFATISEAFSAINAGTHSGTIVISVNGNTTEPAAPVYLVASGQGAASYTGISIKPTVVATIAGATTAGSAVINLDGADFVTIDGSIAVGGTTRDLTIQNTAANTVANVACIRLIGRTTLGLGATNITIDNCNIIGNTPGSNGLSGSTATATYGIYAGSAVLTTMASASAGNDYDNIIVRNNLIVNAYIGVHVSGAVAPNQADNLQVLDNTIGSLTNRIGFKGFVGLHLVGGNITNNTVTAIQNTQFVNIAGIEVGGTATAGFQVRRNTIFEIQQFSPSQYGAYGINITGGVGVVAANNVIYGVQTVNYASTSTTWQAYGIRLAGGTGHGIYYNSVNMYGSYSTPASTYALSAALTVTGTGVIGLDIRNNVFANKMTTNAASGEFLAVYFPTGYNFANANLENNAYMVNADASHYVGKVGATAAAGLYSGLTAWKTISQVGNAANDVNSVPSAANSNAPFTSDVDLTIPAATVTVLESTGLAVASLGLPNVDRTNLVRPAFGGANPDMGAYEFNGSQPSDLVAPTVSGVSAAPGASCTIVSHTITATASDNVGVTSVTLSYSYAGVAQTPITMTFSSGTALSGTYTGVIPAAAGPNVSVAYSVRAIDGAGNLSSLVVGTNYADQYLIVTASADQTINTGTGTTVSATANDPSFGRFVFSEIIQYKSGTGDGVYPTYIPTADNDFIEISNFGDVAADAGGYSVTIYGGVNGTYTIPANTMVPSGTTLVLAFSGTASDPANRYFGMNLGVTTSSNVANGYVLRSPQGQIKDVVATNSYVFTLASGVTTGDWSGNLASSSGLAGVRRTVATDNNVATDWTLSSATNLTTVGVYNSQITIIPAPQTIVWTNSFGPATSTSNPLTVASFATPGTYTYTATFSDGTCTSSDDVVITVIAPTPPVAAFVATPLSGTAPLVVNFTDQSTNVPSTWAWTVAPMTGVTYVSSTNASSQNPVMQFANAGMYTITLTASNIAGSDDSTIVQYINVDWCASNATSTADTDIGNVTFGALNNGVATPIFSNPTANATYTDFTGLLTQSFGIGTTYPISVSQITSGTTFYNAHANVFIDLNNDGSFDPVNERVFNGATSSTGPVSTVSGTVTIPATAVTGDVRMRVILQEGGTATSPPCGTYGYGETEDYIIKIECTTAAPTTSSASICAGNTATLTTTGVGIQWFATATSTAVLGTGTSFTTPPLTSTTSYYASATGTGCGQSPRTQFTVTVNQSTTASQSASTCTTYTWPVNGMTYSTAGTYSAVIPNAAGCDSTITLTLTVNAATNSTTNVTSCGAYTWSANSQTYTTPGTYTATLVNAAGCDSIATLILAITSINLTVTQSGGVATVAQASAIYQWLNCETNAPISGATLQSYAPTVTGNYAVKVTVDGCVDTSACVNMVVSPNSIGENKVSAVSIVPNPTSSFVIITFEAPEAQLTILDLNGKIMRELVVNSGDAVDMSAFENGVYLFTLYSDSIRSIERVVKQ